MKAFLILKNLEERKILEKENIKSPSEIEVEKVNNEGGFLVGISQDEEGEKENESSKSGKSKRKRNHNLSSIRRSFSSSNSAFASCKLIFYVIIFII